MTTVEPGEDATRQPNGQSGRAELLSTQALAIQFVGRTHELTATLEHLLPEGDASARGRSLIVRGDSGTGKTFFVRELMRRLNEERPTALCLYVDVANDEYQSARIMASLLRIVLIPGGITGSSSISVPEKLSLQRYRRHSTERGMGRGFLRAIARAIGAVFGFGSAVGAALDAGAPELSRQVEDELVGYLAWASKRNDVFLAVDNVQFLSLDMRLTLESVVQRAGHRMRLIVLDRTVQGISQLDPPIRCFADAQETIRIEPLTPSETRDVVIAAIGDDRWADRLAQDIFTKTDGLAKDVEYCLRRYSLELGRGARAGAIEGLLSTINRLPLIHREFLVIAALLDGGVQQAIARGTVARLTAAYDSEQLDQIVEELIACDYLRLNGESGDRLRAGHERIVTAIRDLADDELQDEVRRSLIVELTAALDSPSGESTETYLLHCLVGLQTAHELARNVDYISRLIQSQHRQDQFSYLVAIVDELYDVLPLLPSHILNDLLDAMQKSSAFEKGLQVLTMLDATGVPGSAERQLYRMKYLTQAYRYDEALALSEALGDGEWTDLYRINALMALDRNDEAFAIASARLAPALSEVQAVLRRNTITLFDTRTALRHLDESYLYFERAQSDFRLATVDTNRSLVYLDAHQWGDALRCLERSIDRMRFVGSREIYQAQLNLAIRSAMLLDYESALATLDEADLHVPRALLFDQVKIAVNRAVISCAAGRIDREMCTRELLSCADRIRGLQMSYLHKVIAANVAIARGETSPAPNGRGGRVRLTAELWTGETLWSLPMSVHWRY